MRTSRISTAIILSLLLFLTSCIVTNKYSFNSYSVDLTNFEKQGIFVTTGDFSQKYKSISIVGTVCYDGYTPKSEYIAKKAKKNGKKSYQDDIYSSNNPPSESLKNFDYKACDLNDLFEEIINEAKEQGANGIIKLEIKRISGTRQGIEIQGLAIKIED